MSCDFGISNKFEVELPHWLEEIKKSSLIIADIADEVFELSSVKTFLRKKRGKIFGFLILLKSKGIYMPKLPYKARLVMDRSQPQIGVDVFDTYALVIDYSFVHLLISLT